MGKAVVVFAPHPDDETLACGGTIAMRVREGHDVHVVFMTDGRNSHLHELGIASDPTPEQVEQIRAREAERAAKVLGVEPRKLVFLGVEDGTLGLNKETASHRVARILSDLRPDEIYYPDEADGHRDHRATCEVVETALQTVQLFPERYRYVVWPEGTAGTKGEAKQVAVDITETLALKRRAISEYRSQVSLFSRQQTRPVLPASFLERFQANEETFLR